jgi:ATP-dependent exoDNAse (exonuclease V) beta subunit
MHKAKGLEFDTVIVPGLGRPGRSDESKLLAWVELPTGLVLAPIAAAAVEEDPLVRWLAHMDKRKTNNEELRLLYVASTRARRVLHLLGDVPVRDRDGVPSMGDPHASSLLRPIWPSVRDEFARQFAARPELPVAAEPERRPIELRRLALDWQAPRPPRSALSLPVPLLAAAESEPTFVWAGDTLRHVGTVVHATLQRISEQGVEAWDASRLSRARNEWKRALAELGVPDPELTDSVERVRRAVSQTLSDERGRWILSGAHTDLRTEYALSGVVDGRVRHIKVDRTFIDEDGVRWIVDYKTGTHEGGDVEGFLDNEQRRYRLQLEAYAELLSRREERPVRMGLYFPLLGGWREWSWANAAAAV